MGFSIKIDRIKLAPFFFLLAVLLPSCKTGELQDDKTDFGRLRTIREIRDRRVKPGIHSTSGFVTGIYHCPPCPAGFSCEPCRRGNSITIAEENKTNESGRITGDELLLSTDDPNSFEKGRKYLFRIEVTDEKLTNDPEFRLIRIIHHQPVNK
ncbi:MAG: hypothetical protein R2747_08350 [Pyrinomonadaceae bacterium]